MKLSFVALSTVTEPEPVRAVRCTQGTTSESSDIAETLMNQGIHQTVRMVRAARIEQGNECGNLYGGAYTSTVRNILPFHLQHSRGGNTGGMVIGSDLAEMVRELVARYGSRLDLHDLQERASERFAIVAESARDIDALHTAQAEIKAMTNTEKEKHPEQ